MMFIMLCAVTALMLFGLREVCGDRPGFQSRVTQHALNYANQKAIDSLAAEVQQVHIPDQSGSTSGLDWTLSNIHITGFTKPGSNIQLIPNTGLTWSASNAGVSLSADWHVQYSIGWIKFSTSGSVDASINSVSFTVTMALGTDTTGRPSIKSGGCGCSVGSVDITFHGDLKVILDLFRGVVENKIRDMLPGKLCDAINGLINTNAENALQKLKVMAPLADLFTLDYRLVSAPSFLPDYLETYHKGEITWTKDPQPPPFTPKPLPAYPSSTNMLYLWVGEYVPQSLVYAAHNHGFLRYNLTAKDLPPDERVFLNTTCTGRGHIGLVICIGMLFPPVAQKYPGQTVTLRMNSTVVPDVSMMPNLLTARVAGDIALYIDTPSIPPPYLLTVNVTAQFNLTANISNQLIMGSITGFSFSVGVLDSAVGPIESSVVKTLVGLAMKLFIIPKINDQGAKGFPLPITDNVKFTNTQLQIQQDALMIGTDLVYEILFN